jgi:hypothetical protein
MLLMLRHSLRKNDAVALADDVLEGAGDASREACAEGVGDRVGGGEFAPLPAISHSPLGSSLALRMSSSTWSMPGSLKEDLRDISGVLLPDDAALLAEARLFVCRGILPNASYRYRVFALIDHAADDGGNMLP